MLLHWGTLGPSALGIDRALWMGTPECSGWKHEITSSGRPDVDRCAHRHRQRLRADRGDGRRRAQALRYVMVSHDNDGVTKFGGDIIRLPSRLAARRPATGRGGAGIQPPRGIPAAMRWRPVTTFLQSVVDMKNAQIPGAYRAWAHDYRPDLPEFIRDVFAPRVQRRAARADPSRRAAAGGVPRTRFRLSRTGYAQGAGACAERLSVLRCSHQGAGDEEDEMVNPKETFLSWPVVRQALTHDVLGRGPAVTSKRTRN